jgi:hypothetical protein
VPRNVILTFDGQALQVIEGYGRHEETRTPALYRVKVGGQRPDEEAKRVTSRSTW